MRKYYIEIDISSYGWSVEGSSLWMGYDFVVAEGSTLSELLEDCDVFTSDQDGGEGKYYKLDDLSSDMAETIEDLITIEFFKLVGTR